jgi:hypothetical protein
MDEDGDGHLTPAELTHALRSTDALAKSGFAAEIPPEALEELIAASDLYGEGYVDVDEFLAAMLANSNYTKTKDAVSDISGCYCLLCCVAWDVFESYVAVSFCLWLAAGQCQRSLQRRLRS